MDGMIWTEEVLQGSWGITLIFPQRNACMGRLTYRALSSSQSILSAKDGHQVLDRPSDCFLYRRLGKQRFCLLDEDSKKASQQSRVDESLVRCQWILTRRSSLVPRLSPFV